LTYFKIMKNRFYLCLYKYIYFKNYFFTLQSKMHLFGVALSIYLLVLFLFRKTDSITLIFAYFIEIIIIGKWQHKTKN
jgi:hypothetical protein